jgi:flagellar basal body-associated protein FliL
MAVKTAATGRRDRTLAVSISVAAVLTVASVWAYAHFNRASFAPERPKPVWLGVTSAMPQLTDGHMMQVQVSLRLEDQESLTQVSPHAPALKALVVDVAQDMSSHDLVGTRGMQRYGKAIKTAMNEYLAEQHVNDRVRQVAFEDMVILP